jgi:hypothetical protein
MVQWVNEKTSAARSEAGTSQIQSRPAGFKQKAVSQLCNLRERIIQHKVNSTGIIVYNIDKYALKVLYKNKRS